MSLYFIDVELRLILLQGDQDLEASKLAVSTFSIYKTAHLELMSKIERIS
jgi:hypothetical protein